MLVVPQVALLREPLSSVRRPCSKRSFIDTGELCGECCDRGAVLALGSLENFDLGVTNIIYGPGSQVQNLVLF